MKKLRRLIVAALLMAMCLGYSAVAQACPGCAEAQAGQGANRTNIVRGYQLSIIFMMSMPFLIVGSFGGYVYYTVRRSRKDGETTEANVTEDATTSNDA